MHRASTDGLVYYSFHIGLLGEMQGMTREAEMRKDWSAWYTSFCKVSLVAYHADVLGVIPHMRGSARFLRSGRNVDLRDYLATLLWRDISPEVLSGLLGQGSISTGS